MASIQKYPDKQSGPYWRVQVRKRGHTASKILGTRKAADDWARKAEIAILDGDVDRQIELQAQETVAEILVWYIKEYVTGSDPDVAKPIATWSKPESWKKPESTDPHRVKAILVHDIGGIRSSELTVYDVQRYVDDRLKCVQPATVKRDIELLRSALNRAAGPKKGIKLPNGNPVTGVELPVIENSRVNRVIRDDEYDYIEAVAIHHKNPEFLAIIDFARETAMRRGEILKLTVDMVETNGAITLLKLPPGITKTKESRYVPLTSRAVAILAALDEHDEGRLFGYSKSGFKSAWQRLQAKTKALYAEDMTLQNKRINPEFLNDFRFHDIRGTEACRLASRGWTLVEIAALTGHRDLQTLKKFYARVAAEDVAGKLLDHGK